MRDNPAVLTELVFEIYFSFFRFIVGELDNVGSRRNRVGIGWRGGNGGGGQASSWLEPFGCRGLVGTGREGGVRANELLGHCGDNE